MWLQTPIFDSFHLARAAVTWPRHYNSRAAVTCPDIIIAFSEKISSAQPRGSLQWLRVIKTLVRGIWVRRVPSPSTSGVRNRRCDDPDEVFSRYVYFCLVLGSCEKKSKAMANDRGQPELATAAVRSGKTRY